MCLPERLLRSRTRRAIFWNVCPIGTTAYGDYTLYIDEHGRMFGVDLYGGLTFWGEDTVELHVPGSPLFVRLVLDALDPSRAARHIRQPAPRSDRQAQHYLPRYGGIRQRGEHDIGYRGQCTG